VIPILIRRDEKYAANYEGISLLNTYFKTLKHYKHKLEKISESLYLKMDVTFKKVTNAVTQYFTLHL
jgi:hypothetical protein